MFGTRYASSQFSCVSTWRTDQSQTALGIPNNDNEVGAALGRLVRSSILPGCAEAAGRARGGRLGAGEKDRAPSSPAGEDITQRIKKRADAEEKLTRKGYKSAKQLTDVMRVGFTVDRPPRRSRCQRAWRLLFGARPRLECLPARRILDRKLALVMPDDTLAEVQIFERHIAEVKFGEGHRLNEEARKLPSGDPRIAELRRAQLYSAASREAGAADPAWDKLSTGEALASSGRNARLQADSSVSQPESTPRTH